MTDLEIRYPSNLDLLPLTTQVSVNVGDNINALRDAILNLEQVLGLNVNVGLFSSDPTKATVAERLIRLERGIAERNLVFRELNVSDALQILLTPDNKPTVRIGRSGQVDNIVSPVTIIGPLTILAPAIENPRTFIQTPVSIDVTSYNSTASASSLIKGRSNNLQPLLSIQDTNLSPADNEFALDIVGNVRLTGKLTAQFSIQHSQLLGTDTVPTNATRGLVKHVTQGDWHSHRKKQYDTTNKRWIVDSAVNTQDFGVIRHNDLVGIGTLPTDGDEFAPTPGTSYHVTGGDLHDHKSGRGAQIDHNDLKNINPKYSNHISGGDSHIHNPSLGDGGQISHTYLSDVTTTGTNALHVTGGDTHAHSLDVQGNPVGDGAQINHKHLSNISTTAADALHVTGGDNHAHTSSGDGGKISHNDLNDIGTLTHSDLETKIYSIQTTLSIHKHTSQGDGGQIAHTNLSGIGQRTHDQIDTQLSSLQSYLNLTTTTTTIPTNGLSLSSTNTLSFNTNSAQVGYIDGYGAWTIGSTSNSQTHTLNGRLNLGSVETTLPNVGLYKSATNVLNFSTNSTNVGNANGTGAWTFGPSAGGQNHTLNGRLNLGTVETTLPSVGLYQSAINTLSFSTNSTNVGSVGSSGAWTLGSSSTLTNKQTVYGELDGYGTSITLSNSSFTNSLTHIKNAGTATSLNTGATATFAFGTGAGVMLMITNTTSNNSALYFISNSSSAVMADPSSTFSNISGTASRTNITSSTGTVTLQNNTGATASYKIVAVSTT